MQTTSEQNQNINYSSLGGIHMFKEMKKRIKNEKGLTLIELLAVIVILAIIAAIAIPAIGNIIDNSRVKAAKADAANIVSAANLYFTENATATTFSDTTTDWASYVADKGSLNTFTVTKGTGSNPAEIAATGTINGKNYTITATTIKGLKVDKGDETDDNFQWDSNSVDSDSDSDSE